MSNNFLVRRGKPKQELVPGEDPIVLGSSYRRRVYLLASSDDSSVVKRAVCVVCGHSFGGCTTLCLPV